MSYHTGVYREQGGNKLIVQSSSAGPTDSGEIEVQTGGKFDLQSGSSFSMDTDLEIGSGGSVALESGAAITLASGSNIQYPVQTLGSSQAATNIVEYGVTVITATTTAPTYTLAGPSVTGLQKTIFVESNTSSGTLVVNSASTGVSFNSSGDNTLTANAINDTVTLVATALTKWRIISNVGSVGTGTQST